MAKFPLSGPNQLQHREWDQTVAHTQFHQGILKLKADLEEMTPPGRDIEALK